MINLYKKALKYIFILKYNDKIEKFKTISKRQNFIKENKIKNGICENYLNGVKTSGYSFNINY